MIAGMDFSRVAFRRAIAVCAAVAACALATGAHLQRARGGDFEPFQASGTTRIVIPTAFALPASDSGLRLTTIVTTDLDSDGDLDVVASDGAAHLFVWINDGAGHFTRKDPRPNDDRQPTTSTPTVSERPANALVSLQPAGAVALSN